MMDKISQILQKYQMDSMTFLGKALMTPYVIKDMFEWILEMNNTDAYYRWDDNGEVIGNIYSNPELLKES